MIKNISNGYRNVCKSCPYYVKGANPNRNHIHIEIENNNFDILIALQAPGTRKWKHNQPLYHAIDNKNVTGTIMYDSWTMKGKSRNDFDILEVVRCYPGKMVIVTLNQVPSQSKFAHL